MYTIPIQLSIRKFNAALNVRVIILVVPQVVYVFQKNVPIFSYGGKISIKCKFQNCYEILMRMD